ncbi:hypothetical protein Bp8pS_081 [Bacillus phage vB_BpuM-BpSp]|nr:hypothetical protein Bp8pS_081 [Bacillus phage vB_BpuM-BpSp]
MEKSENYYKIKELLEMNPYIKSTEIAKRLNLTPATIYYYIKLYNMRDRNTEMNSRSIETVRKIKEAIKNNPHYNIRQIGESVGISGKSAFYYITAYNLAYKSNEEKVKEYLKENPVSTIEQISEALKIKHNTVYNIIYRNDLKYLKKKKGKK